MSSSSEDDSGEDNGERIKNVSSLLIMRPGIKSELDSNYVFKRRLGDLIFDANFEAGNLGSVKQIDKFTYDLMVRPDVANPRVRIWFNFIVSNQRPDQCVIFSLVNLSEKLHLANKGFTPVVRSRMYPNWIRLNQDQVFYYSSPNHNNRYILTIAFKFASCTTGNDEHQFALFYPYPITNLIQFVNRWSIELKRPYSADYQGNASSSKITENIQRRSVSVLGSSLNSQLQNTFKKPIAPRSKSSLGFVARNKQDVAPSSKTDRQTKAQLLVSNLTDSTLSKPIYRLEIGQYRAHKLESRTKVIVLGGWSGNFESATQYVCQGLIDFMLSDDIIAKAARQHLDLIVFPIPDPDSIWSGNGRSDLFGQIHLSQEVMRANPRLYRGVNLMLENIHESCASSESVVILELRVNPELIGSRVVGTNYGNTFRMERHLFLPRLFSRFTDGFYLEKCEFIDSDKQSRRCRLFDFHS